jgi:cell division septation protein DedD
MSSEIIQSDRLSGLAALSKAVDLNAQAQPLTPIGRPTTTLELMAAQRVAVPRHIPEMMQRLKILASVAGSEYYYQFPVRSKNKETGEWEQSFIEGPTIKLANDLAREYGNCGVETHVVDIGDSWVIYARFVDIERGFTMVRPFQQRKNQKGLGTKDEARALDIALQIGVSKAIRNVVLNSLETYADFMFDEAKSGIIDKVRKQPELYRGKILTRLKELGVAPARVEAQVGRAVADWRADDITRVIAQIKAVGDGMATAFEIWPEAHEFVGPPEAAADPTPAAAPTPKAEPEKPAPAPVEAKATAPAPEPDPEPEHMSEGLQMALGELQKMAAAQIDDLLAIAAERLDEDEYKKLADAALERKEALANKGKAKR